MNREEAIKELSVEYVGDSERIIKAKKMAIKALEQMPVTTTAGEGGVIYYPQVEGVTPTVVDAGKQEPSGDAIDRKLVCAFIAGLISDDEERKKGLEYIRNMPPVNPQPCEDAIDRAEAIKIASGYCHPANVAKELAKLPSVNPQPCEDAISKQAVLDLIVANHTELNGVNVVMYSPLYKDIKQLPSVKPQLKTGHWIHTNEFFINQDGQFIYKFICSECKSLSYFRKSNKQAIGANVCPNCGAKMSES